MLAFAWKRGSDAFNKNKHTPQGFFQVGFDQCNTIKRIWASFPPFMKTFYVLFTMLYIRYNPQ